MTLILSNPQAIKENMNLKKKRQKLLKMNGAFLKNDFDFTKRVKVCE